MEHLSYDNSTWENYEVIKTEFPDFHHEDKEQLIGEGNNVKAIKNNKLKTYARRDRNQDSSWRAKETLRGVAK